MLFISPTLIFVCLIYTFLIYARHFLHCLQLILMKHNSEHLVAYYIVVYYSLRKP